MSPHAVNSLVSDLVSMAKAMEELPLVQQELQYAQESLERLNDALGEREAEINGLNNKIVELTLRLKSTEASRDDAELRFLELDERAGKAIAFLASAAAHMVDAKELLKEHEAKSAPLVEAYPASASPAAPVSTAEPLPDAIEPSKSSGESATDPTVSQTHSDDYPSVTGTTATLQEDALASEGVSVQPDPSPVTTISPQAKLPSFAEADVLPLADATSPSNPIKSYLGRRYSEFPGWISYDSWIAWGGTDEDYYH